MLMIYQAQNLEKKTEVKFRYQPVILEKSATD